MSHELFVSTYAQASGYAHGTASRPADVVDLGDVSDLELEVLGELAVRKTHATGVETTLSLVDVDLDSLLAFPESLTGVFAELSALAEPSAAVDLAQQWAGTEEFEADAATASRLLEQVSALAQQVWHANPDAQLSVYYLAA